MKKNTFLTLLILLFAANLFAQRVQIENEKNKCKENKAMFDLILFAQLFPLQKDVFPIRDIKTFIDKKEYVGTKGDIWFSALSNEKNKIYSGVWAEVDESMTLFASFYTENDSLKFCLIKRESGIINEVDNYSAPIKELNVIPTKNNKLLEEFTTTRGIRVVIKETNKLSSFNFANAIFLFPDNARF